LQNSEKLQSSNITKGVEIAELPIANTDKKHQMPSSGDIAQK
jgi:hypothetical protein